MSVEGFRAPEVMLDCFLAVLSEEFLRLSDFFNSATGTGTVLSSVGDWAGAFSGRILWFSFRQTAGA